MSIKICEIGLPSRNNHYERLTARNLHKSCGLLRKVGERWFIFYGAPCWRCWPVWSWGGAAKAQTVVYENDNLASIQSFNSNVFALKSGYVNTGYSARQVQVSAWANGGYISNSYIRVTARNSSGYVFYTSSWVHVTSTEATYTFSLGSSYSGYFSVNLEAYTDQPSTSGFPGNPNPSTIYNRTFKILQ